MTNPGEIKDINNQKKKKPESGLHPSQVGNSTCSRIQHDVISQSLSDNIESFNDLKKRIDTSEKEITRILINQKNTLISDLSNQLHDRMSRLSSKIPDLSPVISELADLKNLLNRIIELLDRRQKDKPRHVDSATDCAIDMFLTAAEKVYQEQVKNRQTTSRKLIHEIDPIYKGLSRFQPKSSSPALIKIRKYLSDLSGNESTEADLSRDIIDFPAFLQKRIEQRITMDTSDDTFDYEKIRSDYVNHVGETITAYYRGKLHASSRPPDNRETVQQRLEEYGIIDVLDMIRSGANGPVGGDKELTHRILALIEWEIVPIRLNVDKVDVRIHDILGTQKVQDPDLHGCITEVVKEGYKTTSGAWVRKPLVRHGVFS